MFNVTNISNNPLTISDGKLLAAGDSRSVETVNERMKSFETRGWLMISEADDDTSKADAEAKAKADAEAKAKADAEAKAKADAEAAAKVQKTGGPN